MALTVGGPLRSPSCPAGRQPGIDYLINLAAVLSVSIGLLNLFRCRFDGGHLLFYTQLRLFVVVRYQSARKMGFRVGLALVLMLMIFATYNDIPTLRVRKVLRAWPIRNVLD